jgi:hypothetical protein
MSSLEQHLGVDGHGWRRCDGGARTPEQRVESIRFTLGQYQSVLEDFLLADRPAHALHDLLVLCCREHIPTALVIPPECSAFRSSYHAGQTAIDDHIRGLAREFDLPLYDTRDWVGDDGFWDGHHLETKGADAYTERFAHEALGPLLARIAGGNTGANRR